MKLNCLVVDDEPLARKVVAEFIEETDFLCFAGMAENPVKAAAMLSESNYDLVFLDINMPKISGIDFLRNGNIKPMVILTTAYTEYALDGFENAVIDYLVKPFSYERFFKACLKAKEQFDLRRLSSTPDLKDQKQDDHFYVKAAGRLERINYDDLLFFEASQNYVLIHTGSKKLMVYLTLKALTDHLPAHQFVKVHKSYVVNIYKIQSIEGCVLHISGGQSITISHAMHEEVLKLVLKGKLVKR